MSEFFSVAECMTCLLQDPPPVVIVDWTLGQGSASEVIVWARGNVGWDMGIVVVCPSEQRSEVATALLAGADDLVCDPIDRREFDARLIAAGRRWTMTDEIILEPYIVDTRLRSVAILGKRIELTPSEFKISCRMLRSPYTLLRREDLLVDLWGPLPNVQSRTVDMHVTRIRKKLGLDGTHGWTLVTQYGLGWRLQRTGLTTAAESLERIGAPDLPNSQQQPKDANSEQTPRDMTSLEAFISQLAALARPATLPGFNGEASVREWMARPVAALGWRRPLDVIGTRSGRDEVARCFGRILAGALS